MAWEMWYCQYSKFVITSYHGNAFRITGPFVMGIHRLPVDSTHKILVMEALMKLVCPYCWIYSQVAGDLRHYDTAMNVFGHMLRRLGRKRSLWHTYLQRNWFIDLLIYLFGLFIIYLSPSSFIRGTFTKLIEILPDGFIDTLFHQTLSFSGNTPYRNLNEGQLCYMSICNR